MFRLCRFRVGGVMLLLGAAAAVEAAPAYNAPVDFSRPGYASTQPWGINDGGVIVGTSDDVGFVYSGGVFTSYERAAWDRTSLSGIASDGTLIGFSTREEPGQIVTTESFVVVAGTLTPFLLPGATSTTLRGISGNGRYLAGTYEDAGFGGGFVFDTVLATYQAIASGEESVVILQGVNDSGLAVGSVLDLSTGSVSRIGIVVDAATGTRSDTVDIGAANGAQFRGINNAGTIVGSAAGSLSFVGAPGDGWLLDLAPPPAGFSSTFAYGINTQGTVVGFYAAAGITQGWVATPVPEPAAWALLLTGLAAVGAASQRRNAR